MLEKIKEKLPSHQHETVDNNASTKCAMECHYPKDEPKEKKGILEEIKDKIPGCHKNENEKNK